MPSHDWVRRNFDVDTHAAERWLQRVVVVDAPYTERQLDRAKYAVSRAFTDALNASPPVHAGGSRFEYTAPSGLRFIADRENHFGESPHRLITVKPPRGAPCAS
jgi:hypothetical protein